MHFLLLLLSICFNCCYSTLFSTFWLLILFVASANCCRLRLPQIRPLEEGPKEPHTPRCNASAKQRQQQFK